MEPTAPPFPITTAAPAVERPSSIIALLLYLAALLCFFAGVVLCMKGDYDTGLPIFFSALLWAALATITDALLDTAWHTRRLAEAAQQRP